jgi:hypothetical protein
MNITRRKALGAVLGCVLVGTLGVQWIGKPAFVIWLRAHSTVRLVEKPPGGHFSIAVYRYPRLKDIPEYLGLGQGYVQLFETHTGKVLQEKAAEDLTAIRNFAWGPASVTIDGFAEWPVAGRHYAGF